MDVILSILMAAGLGLLAGSVVLFRRGERKKGLLMAAAALVMFANVAIWLIPTRDGAALIDAGR